MKFKNALKSYLGNVLGWHTNRKIIVIESDDWGTIRMASKSAFDFFNKKGYPVDLCPYNANDSLESNQDLEMLFYELSSVKDLKGNPAIITANNVVANPNFDKIRKSNFTEYHYEAFTDTLKRYPKHDKVKALYLEGIARKVFKPQFHAREHLNIARWLRELQNNNATVHMAFDQYMFSVHSENLPAYTNEFMDALDIDNKEQLSNQKLILTEGLSLFEELWGFKSKSFIAPCYIWHSSLEPILKEKGIHYLQGIALQFEPIVGKPFMYRKKRHFLGKKNTISQYYLRRNAFFEPSLNQHYDWENDCLYRISVAFQMRKPAIISSHRLNFMGGINPINRERNLIKLRSLLFSIKKKWPDIEFLSSDQLGDMIAKSI